MKPELQVYRDMYELLKDSSRWTTRYLARDKFGMPILSAHGGRAHSFCLLGAAERVDRGRMDDLRPHLDVLLSVVERRGWPSIPKFNDENEHETVMTALREAIDICESREASICAKVSNLINTSTAAATKEPEHAA